jgi:hypothetical protein
VEGETSACDEDIEGHFSADEHGLDTISHPAYVATRNVVHHKRAIADGWALTTEERLTRCAFFTAMCVSISETQFRSDMIDVSQVHVLL